MSTRTEALDDEEVLRVHPHGRALALPLLALLVVLAAAGYAAARLEQPGARWAVAGVAVLLVLRLSLLPWLRWLATVLVVAPDLVAVERGLLRRTRRGVSLSRVVDVGVERSLLQRLLRTGTLVVTTVGDGPVLVVHDVPRVLRVADRLDELVERTPLDDE